MTTLLPCPHCGGKEHEIGNGDAGYTITCHSFACRASTGAWASETEAREAWNRRLSPSPTGGEAGAVGEIVSVEGSLGDMHVIKWTNGHTPKVGDKLYTHPAPLMDEVVAVLKPFAEAAEWFAGFVGTAHVTLEAESNLNGKASFNGSANVDSIRAASTLLTKLQEGGL